jgi:hypothetical protein
MTNDRASCHSSDHNQDSLADKLGALFQSSGLFGLTGEQNKSKTIEHSTPCVAANSPFALPALELTETGKAGNGDHQKIIDDSVSKLEPVVGHEKLSEALSHFAKLPQTEKEDFLRSLNAIVDDDSKTSNLATKRLIANELIDQVNHPEKIKQGFKGTCGLAAVEIDIAASRPDIYARAVARWSKMIDTTASTKDDVATALHYPNMIIDRDDESHHRTLVSRIFQTGAANLMLAGSGKRYESFTSAEAPEIKTPEGPFKPDRDTGERVLDSTGKVLTWEGVSLEEQAALLTELTERHFTADKIYPTSPEDLVAKLRGQLAKTDTPINLPLHSVEGAHAITVVKIGDQNQSADVFYLNTASSNKRLLRMSAQKLYDTTIDGDDVVRIGNTEEIDGLTFRKPYKLPANASPFVSVVHGD